MNKFLERVNQFEKITNEHMTDLWRIKDMAFQPLETTLDIQEYIPGLFDIVKPNQSLPITKVMSVFCYLQIESINLKNEIEQKFFDPLIFFGESGFFFDPDLTDEEYAGKLEIEMSRSLPVYNEFFETIKKIVALTKNILLQMNGLFNSKYPLYSDFFKKINYSEIFDNLGSTLTNLYIVDLIIQENLAFKDYWEQYNDMFATVKSNLDKYNMTSKMLKRLQKFCSKIY